LSDNETFSSAKGVIMEQIRSGFPTPPAIFISMDPPSHTVYRNLFSQAFTAPRMAKLEQQIRAFCARTLDPLVGESRFDLIREFSSQVPMRVIGMLLGIPEEDQEDIRERADRSLRTEIGQPMKRGQPDADITFDDYISFRQQHPADDLMSELIHAEFEDETGTVRKLRLDEVRNLVGMLATAGNETTNKLIGWTAKLLAEHPDQRRAIYEDRSLILPAVEEILRYEPPAPYCGRYVARDFEAYGQTVPAGSVMMFLVGAANRDERQFEDPEAFDIHRDRKLNLGFGYGPHLCLGAALARVEGRIALDELLNRFPEWDIDEAGASLIPTSTVRGWDTLPMVIG
jgi:cytochrome P450